MPKWLKSFFNLMLSLQSPSTLEKSLLCLALLKKFWIMSLVRDYLFEDRGSALLLALNNGEFWLYTVCFVHSLIHSFLGIMRLHIRKKLYLEYQNFYIILIVKTDFKFLFYFTHTYRHHNQSEQYLRSNSIKIKLDLLT